MLTAAELRRIRKRLGETQKSLAERLGVARRTVQSWEIGARNIPAPVQKLLATFPPLKSG